MPLIYTDTPESTAIARVGYDPLIQMLTIVFRDRPSYPEYQWAGIDKEMAIHFLIVAQSKGKWYHRNLKDVQRFQLRPFFGSRRLAAIGRRIKNVVYHSRP